MYKRNRVFLGQNRISRSQGTLFTSPKLQHSPGRCRGNCCSYAHICENSKLLLENFTFSSAISNANCCQCGSSVFGINFLPEMKETIHGNYLLKICLVKKRIMYSLFHLNLIRLQFIKNGVFFHKVGDNLPYFSSTYVGII